jgi:hypothetical protein
LGADVVSHLYKRLRENRLTLDELRADLESHFPDLEKSGDLPSRSALHRHSQSIKDIVAHEREMQAAANALVAELGEDFDSKSGALLAQAVTTLASKRAHQAIQAVQGGSVMDISDVLDLARAAKVAQEARSLNLKERHFVATEARKKQLAELAEKLKAMPTKGGVTEDTKQAIRAALGIV